MKKAVAFLAASAAAVVTSTVCANFTEFTTVTTTLDSGLTKVEVFANFDSTDDVLLNCFDFLYTGGVNTSGMTGFIHTDAAQSWAPQFAGIPGPAEGDSYVTIGGLPNFGNTTTADPGWGEPGFLQPGIPDGAGWYNNNPPNLQGSASKGPVKVAQFVYGGSKKDLPDLGWFFDLSVGWNQGPGTDSLTARGSVIIGVPAPGALALLAFAGVPSRRRRVA